MQSANTIQMPTPAEFAKHNNHVRTVRLGCLLEQVDALVDTAIDEDGERAQVLLHAARELLELASGEVFALQQKT